MLKTKNSRICISKKLKAGALVYALAVSLVITVLLMLLILFSYYNSIYYQNLDRAQSLRDNTLSGLEILKSSNYKNGFYEMDLFHNTKDSVRLSKEYWGGYFLNKSTAFKRGRSITKAGLYGVEPSGIMNAALYISDNDKGIGISVDGLIEGDAYLPKAGIKRRIISGQNYVEPQLVFGNILESKSTLPPLNSMLLNYVKKSFNKEFCSECLWLDLEVLSANERAVQSFNDSTIFINSQETIYLNNFNVSGNVVFKSDVGIYISGNSSLNDVVIIAPKILFADDFVGNIHVIAKDSVILGNDVSLTYPTSILLHNEIEPVVLRVGDDSKVSGMVLVNGFGKGNEVSLTELSESSEITGWMYCKGDFLSSGSIIGSLFAEQFYLKTASAVYQNLIMNCKISAKERNEAFIASDFLGIQSELKLVKSLE